MFSPRIINANVRIIFLLSNLLLLINVSYALNYYSDSNAGDPIDVNNWWSNTDNTGTHPTGFDGSSDVFIVQFGHNYTTTDVWNVTYDVWVRGNLTAAHDISAGHDLEIHQGGNFYINQDVIVDIDGDVSGEIDNNNLSGDIIFNGAGSLYIGKHFYNEGILTTVDGSTVKYKLSNGSSRVLKLATYFHLIIDKGAGTNAEPAGNVNVNGDLTIASGDLKLIGSVINVSGNTIIATDGVLKFEDITGEVYLADLYLTGGWLGGKQNAVGKVDCSNLTITSTTNEIGRAELTVNGITTVDGEVDFTSSQRTKTFQGDVTVNGTWNNTGNSTVIMNSNLIINGTFNSLTGNTTVTGINNKKK